MDVQNKVVELLFKEYVICDVLVDELLPQRTFTPEFRADLTPEQAYGIARNDLKENLKKYIGK